MDRRGPWKWLRGTGASGMADGLTQAMAPPRPRTRPQAQGDRLIGAEDNQGSDMADGTRGAFRHCRLKQHVVEHRRWTPFRASGTGRWIDGVSGVAEGDWGVRHGRANPWGLEHGRWTPVRASDMADGSTGASGVAESGEALRNGRRNPWGVGHCRWNHPGLEHGQWTR